MKPNSGSIGVAIVSYNSADFLGPCLESALPHAAEVVVVDNASTDDSPLVAARYHGLRLILNDSNRGFAAAVNQAISSITSPLVLLLNPDTALVTPLSPLVEAFRQPEVAAAAGKLIDAAGNPQRGFTLRRFPTPATLCLESMGVNRVWPSNPVNRGYRCADLNLEQAQEAEQPAGAFLMIRRETWQKLGGFDEQFHPLWFEDVDFLMRACREGYRVRYEPGAVAVHHGGHSVAGMDPVQRRKYWYGSLLRYSAKHFGPLGVRAVAASVLVGCGLRAVIGRSSTATTPTRRTEADEYAKVVRLAARYCLTGRTLDGDRVTGASAEGELANKSKLRNSHSHGL